MNCVLAILQIALDTHDLITAIRIASSIVSELGCENIWIEAGTPFIKSWGIIGIDVLKKTTGCFLVADTKTMDTGDYEAEIVLGAGANAFSILSLASDETIRAGLEQARKMNGLVIVDLINHPNPVERAIEIDKLGVDIILYHVGLDGKKMSSSKPDYAIFLLDDEQMIRKKIMNALTGGRPTAEEQRKLGGDPSKCTIYELYMYLLYRDDKELLELYNNCRNGQILCGQCKRRAYELLIEIIRGT